LTVTTTLIISIVKSSLALSLGLVGALSIVRFRAAIKEPEELAFLFIAMQRGLGSGRRTGLGYHRGFGCHSGFVALRSRFSRGPDTPNLYLTVATNGSGRLGPGQILEALGTVGATASLKRLDETPEQVEAAFIVDFQGVGKLEQFTKRLRELSPSVRVSCWTNGVWDNDGIAAQRAVRAQVRGSRGGLPEVLAMVRRHPVGFIEAYLPRMVNNIYLDSPGLNSFFDHINGVSNRAKTRVRWYGDWNGSALHRLLSEN
jgi:hypothetical protein